MSETKQDKYRVPITVIIFKRPDVTRALAEVIHKVQPEKLYIIADAARKDHEGEQEKVNECRNIMEKAVPQENQIHIYAEKNMGCDPRIVSGLNEVFAQVEMSIVLEDDCIPDLSFFPYCEELLARYANEERIKFISGSNRTTYPMQNSYNFIHFANTWGWASWSRAWKQYQDGKANWLAHKTNGHWREHILASERKSFVKQMNQYAEWENFPWDEAWGLQMYENDWLSIVPKYNMVANIGYGEEATHLMEKDVLQKWKSEKMPMPLQHPPVILYNEGYERWKHKERWKENMIYRFKKYFRLIKQMLK